MKNETKQQTAVEFLAEQFDNIVELYPSQFEKINEPSLKILKEEFPQNFFKSKSFKNTVSL